VVLPALAQAEEGFSAELARINWPSAQDRAEFSYPRPRSLVSDGICSVLGWESMRQSAVAECCDKASHAVDLCGAFIPFIGFASRHDKFSSCG
jgi:hypothetical protein